MDNNNQFAVNWLLGRARISIWGQKEFSIDQIRQVTQLLEEAQQLLSNHGDWQSKVKEAMNKYLELMTPIEEDMLRYSGPPEEKSPSVPIDCAWPEKW